MRTLAKSPSSATSVCVAAAAALVLTSPRHRCRWVGLLLVAEHLAPAVICNRHAAELMADEAQGAAGQRLRTCCEWSTVRSRGGSLATCALQVTRRLSAIRAITRQRVDTADTDVPPRCCKRSETG